MPSGCLNDKRGWFLCVEHDREEIHPVPDGPKDFVTNEINFASAIKVSNFQSSFSSCQRQELIELSKGFSI